MVGELVSVASVYKNIVEKNKPLEITYQMVLPKQGKLQKKHTSTSNLWLLGRETMCSYLELWNLVSGFIARRIIKKKSVIFSIKEDSSWICHAVLCLYWELHVK